MTMQKNNFIWPRISTLSASEKGSVPEVYPKSFWSQVILRGSEGREPPPQLPLRNTINWYQWTDFEETYTFLGRL